MNETYHIIYRRKAGQFSAPARKDLYDLDIESNVFRVRQDAMNAIRRLHPGWFNLGDTAEITHIERTAGGVA